MLSVNSGELAPLRESPAPGAGYCYDCTVTRPSILCALATSFALFASCATGRPAVQASRDEGKQIVFSAPDLSGIDVDVAAVQGKVRVIEFWASWCEPCVGAMSALDAVARELGPRGLVVYGVSIDERREEMTAFLARRPVSFPILWDQGGARVARFDVRLLPVTLVIDRRGVIRYVRQGWRRERDERDAEQIRSLLAEP